MHKGTLLQRHMRRGAFTSPHTLACKASDQPQLNNGKQQKASMQDIKWTMELELPLACGFFVCETLLSTVGKLR